MNRLELNDTVKSKSFKQLYDVPVESADENFVKEILSAQRKRRLCHFLQGVQPDDSVYHRLVAPTGK